MLHAVPDGGVALTLKPDQPACCRTRDDDIGLLCLSAFEYASALQDESACPVADSANHPFEANEGRRAIGLALVSLGSPWLSLHGFSSQALMANRAFARFLI